LTTSERQAAGSGRRVDPRRTAIDGHAWAGDFTSPRPKAAEGDELARRPGKEVFSAAAGGWFETRP
jgi:hypothetical protein